MNVQIVIQTAVREHTIDIARVRVGVSEQSESIHFYIQVADRV